ncbi:MAG: LysM peptidoglycan-binding domain-containing protein [Anaerovoracaceae bacterium]|nr:LysM peptidoglycan-binding domain-containing protein [Bacillota bacterium]MDY3954136.1 LysM peptidoglycan-binding domain-containing protein [Anaerovoracaceae bacterium]
MTGRTVRKKYRIKSKIRFTAFVAVMMIMSITLLGNVLGLNDAASMSEEPSYRAVEVCYGDTLWDLAKTYGDPAQDVRKLVHTICSVNNMEVDELYPGQTIYIPE